MVVGSLKLFTRPKRSWYDFFEDCLKAGGVMKRLDLAINDLVGLLDIPDLTKNVRRKNVFPCFVPLKVTVRGAVES